MEEWWSQEQILFKGLHLIPEDLYRVVEISQIYLRSGVDSCISLCNSLGIPVTVISGGIGNFVELVLMQLPVKLKGIKANFLEFGSDRVFRGFSQPMIHSGNKSNAVEDIESPAVVLVGDMPSVRYR